MGDVDLVDEEDEVIGTSDEEAATFNRATINRGGAVFIFNSKGELLLQKRSIQKFRYPLHWDSSVGFWVKSGETYDQAAVREVKEEVGVRITAADLVKVVHMKVTTDRTEMYTLFALRHDGPFAINEYEVREIRSLPPEGVERMIAAGEKFSPVFVAAFGKWKELGRPMPK